MNEIETVYWAIRNNDVEVVKRLVTRQNFDPRFLLLSLNKNRYNDVTKYFIEISVSIDTNNTNTHMNYALQSSVIKNNIEHVAFLLDNGALVDDETLKLAIEYDYVNIVRYLINDDRDLSKFCNGSNNTMQLIKENLLFDIDLSIEWAIRNDKIEFMNQLFNECVDLHRALLFSIEYGSPQGVHYFADKGANINNRDIINASLLYQNMEVISTLFNHGCRFSTDRDMLLELVNREYYDVIKILHSCQIEFILTNCPIDALRIILNDVSIREATIEHLLRNNLEQKIIRLLYEYAVDIYDMIEKEN